MLRVFICGGDPKFKAELQEALKIDSIDANTIEDSPGTTSQAFHDSDFWLFPIHNDEHLIDLVVLAQAVRWSVKNPKKTHIYVVGGIDAPDDVATVCGIMSECGAKLFYDFDPLVAELNSHFIELPFDPNMVECLFRKDGETELRLKLSTYVFKKNPVGDYVCEIINTEHRKHLVATGDYRIYQGHLAPEPEFTDEELDFIRVWKVRGKETFQEYVNNNTEKFLNARTRVKKIAYGKWVLLFQDKEGLLEIQCPFYDGVDEEKPPIEEEVGPGGDVNKDLEDLSEEAFVNKWLRMKADEFKEFLNKHEQMFLNASEEAYGKAENKWARMFPEEKFPFEVDEEEVV